ncbi:MAG: prepilin-type N-terminal cleavage/methylation domain-containing protein [Phycisphaerales bacterium]
MRRALAPRRRHAFTLIEMLVSIAIIALLIAIIVPALGHARDTGRLMVCLSNLRGQGQAVASYTLEYQDATPPRLVWQPMPDGDGHTELGRTLINRFLAIWLGEPFPPEPGTPLFIPQGMWRCPEIRSDEEDLRLTHQGRIHHAPNEYLFGIVDYDTDDGSPRTSVDAFGGWNLTPIAQGWRKLTDPPHPVDTVEIMDNVRTYVPLHLHYDAREFFGRSVHVVKDPIEGNHTNDGSHEKLGKRPCVFVDGHGDSLSDSSKYWQQDAHEYRAPGSPFTDSLYDPEVRHFMYFVRQRDRVR